MLAAVEKLLYFVRLVDRVLRLSPLQLLLELRLAVLRRLLVVGCADVDVGQIVALVGLDPLKVAVLVGRVLLDESPEEPLEAVLARAGVAVGVVVVEDLVGATEDLELIRRHAEPAAAVNQKRLVDGQHLINVEIRQIDGRIVGNVEREQRCRRARPDDGEQSVLMLGADDLIGLEDLGGQLSLIRFSNIDFAISPAGRPRRG